MSAVRMVAYGVLEMKHKQAIDWLRDLPPQEQARLHQEDFERDQLRKLVNDELGRYGLLMIRQVSPRSNGAWRTSTNSFVLYGQLERGGFNTRPIIHEGDFKLCCIAAAKLLDELDAAQVPDPIAGSIDGNPKR